MESQIRINRRMFTQDEVDKIYKRQETPAFNCKDKMKSVCSCSAKSLLTSLLSFFPIIKVVTSYRIKYILNDTLAGLSAGFIHLPLGLGLGLLASLQPVYGLYTSFYPVLLYLIFGTSPHISIGTNALFAVLTASIVEREAEIFQSTGGVAVNLNSSDVNGTMLEEVILEYKVGVAMAVTFLAGTILLIMGFLRLGFLTSYLSISFIGGFTTASAVHIATSQIGKMLHLKIKPHAGVGKLVKTYIDIFTQITSSNLGDFLVAAVSIFILLGVKVGINERFKSKLKIPIPIDLILVILSTLVSYLADFQGNYGIAIVGNVPTGMPAPRLPNLQVIPRVGVDSFVIAILIFALTIAMAKLMARLNDYEIDDNQELVAYGMSNFVSSFFLCFPSCVAPPRTMILQSLGSKTTLNGIVSAIFILIILLAAGPLFASLPVAVLAAMIVVAMKNLLLQLLNLPGIWRVSKPDFIIWVATFLVGVFVDLDIGIVVGVSVSILSIIIQNQLSRGFTVSRPDGEQIFLDKSYKSATDDLPGVRIFTFQSQLYFVNAERFKNLLYQNVFNPKSKKAVKEVVLNSDAEVKSGNEAPDHEAPPKDEGEIIDYIILDCIYMTYIDLSGVNILKQIIIEFDHVGVSIYLTRLSRTVLNTLDRSGLFTDFERSNVFYDLHDALYATGKFDNSLTTNNKY